MNFITFNTAYSLYLKVTFDHGVNLTLHNNCYNDQCCHAKYTCCRWRTISNFWPQDKATVQLFTLGHKHFVGDDRCWTILLDLKGVENRLCLSSMLELFTWDPVEHNSRSLATSSRHPWRASTMFLCAKSPIF